MSQDILEKVRVFLEAASKDAVEVSDDLIDQFGKACSDSFRKQFTDQRNKKFGLRASNIGRPLCQLQMEKKGVKGEGQPYNAKMRNLFGDIIEQMAIIVMKAAGVEIEAEQKKIKYNINKGTNISGALDVEIGGKVWDIKSASPWSFTNKFGENGSFHTVATDDVFGYTTQGYVYAEGADKPFGGWIVINKSTGEWTLTETPMADDEYKEKALDTVKKNASALKRNKKFERCYEDEEEYFRKQKTGNRVLNNTCSFCPYKFPCWGENLQLLPQQQSQGKNPKWVWYTQVTNPRVEEDVA
jgi:hypothetical protein|tara:strand:- start:48 stop:944 length:897 start_codon:yes stop_codon:yes gene_type:complete